MGKGRVVCCFCAHGCCPPQDKSLVVSLPLYLPYSHAPPFSSPSLRCSLLPRLASSLPFPSLRPTLRSFLTRSLPQPSPLPSLPLQPSLTSSPSRCSLPSHSPNAPSLPPILHPASLLPCLPPCLPVCLPPPCNSIYTVSCV